ncbi:MAG: carboxylating nicotinate-nucleotide diphosphorylase [Candidatus Glassbacteria bacterium]|nr:carboxylating nicotinate-nucleotide diphosphorylase [Candidatus Glassbacteria bacterium]
MALREDIGEGDFSTRWSVPEDNRSVALIIARTGGVIAGLPVVRHVLDMFDPSPRLVSVLPEGQTIAAGQVVAEIEGATWSLLSLERTVLNFLQRLSGIATLAHRFAASVEGTGVRILDTRKTTPGFRELEKYAVRVGGAFNHRLGLYDYILLKENHLEAAGGIEPALRAVARQNKRGLPVEVETRTIDEVREAVSLGVSRIMLDNMTVEQMSQAVRIIREQGGENRPEIEASGDISLRTVREVAETGVDFISVGALTHSAGILNLTMIIEAVE